VPGWPGLRYHARMRPGTLFALLVAAAGLVGCGDSPPPSPSPGPGGGATINGTERLGWDQQAGSRAELAAFGFAIYVDGARTTMAGVNCQDSAAAGGFPCTGQLPSMSAGAHTLELAAFVMDGGSVLESPRSAPFQVVVAPAIVVPSGLSQTVPPDTPSSPASDADDRFERVAAGEVFDDVRDAALTPDGQLLVAERAGILRVAHLREARPLPSLLVYGTRAAGGTGSLLSVALDPDFERTRTIYVLQTAVSSRDELAYQLVRYRQAGEMFGERAVLMETASAVLGQPAGTVRVGPDGKLYVAMSDPRGLRRTRSGAEAEGRILRLNSDGTTPPDQPSASPVYAAAEGEARGLDWNPDGGELWVAHGGQREVSRVIAVAGDPRRARTGMANHEFSLASTNDISAIAFYRGDLISALQGTLLIAAESGLHRARFDPQDRSRIISLDSFVDTPVRTVIAAPDGQLLLATPDAVLRVRPH